MNLDFGQHVIDTTKWNEEDRVVRVRPLKRVHGQVRVIWPNAPRLAGIVTDNGDIHVIRVIG